MQKKLNNAILEGTDNDVSCCLNFTKATVKKNKYESLYLAAERGDVDIFKMLMHYRRGVIKNFDIDKFVAIICENNNADFLKYILKSPLISLDIWYGREVSLCKVILKNKDNPNFSNDIFNIMFDEMDLKYFSLREEVVCVIIDKLVKSKDIECLQKASFVFGKNDWFSAAVFSSCIRLRKKDLLLNIINEAKSSVFYIELVRLAVKEKEFNLVLKSKNKEQNILLKDPQTFTLAANAGSKELLRKICKIISRDAKAMEVIIEKLVELKDNDLLDFIWNEFNFENKFFSKHVLNNRKFIMEEAIRKDNYNLFKKIINNCVCGDNKVNAKIIHSIVREMIDVECSNKYFDEMIKCNALKFDRSDVDLLITCVVKEEDYKVNKLIENGSLVKHIKAEELNKLVELKGSSCLMKILNKLKFSDFKFDYLSPKLLSFWKINKF